MKIIKLRIQAFDDRNKMVQALASSEYKVWIEEEKDNVYNTTYYVIFEIKE